MSAGASHERDRAVPTAAAGSQQPQVAAEERLAAREREWRADAASAQEAAVHEALATFETEAAATLAAEQARWAQEKDQAVAAARTQAREGQVLDTEARSSPPAAETIQAWRQSRRRKGWNKF